MRRALRLLLTTVGAGYLALVAALFLFQRALLYPAPERVGLPDVPGVEVLWVDYADGRVPMAVRGPMDGSAPVAVWFHGNGGQLGRRATTATKLGEVGISAALAEFPGYGMSTGAGPNETTLLAAARASLALLEARGAPRPACIGHSMGSGVAAAMAAEGRCTALVLLAPYTSLPDIATTHYPFVPGFMLLDRLDALARAADIHVPTLVVHGRQDTVIPVAMGRAVAAAIPSARWVERDGTHNSILDRHTFAAIADLLEPLTLRKPPE
jgi:pimeloyl-ACP methyl ester carboxylesterase